MLMKKIILLFAVALMVMMTAQSQNNPLQKQTTVWKGQVQQCLSLPNGPAKAMPIVSEEPITEAPAGTVFANLCRKGYSYYYDYDYSTVNGGYNDSFVGEYILGDDGCIYIKEACASVVAGSYLKLDRIDDENYVAHTAQVILVDNSGYTPYVVFATRLVFHQYDENSYGYVLETDENENVQADIFFTYKDGVLKQKDQSIDELNGIQYPHELLAFTNSEGAWIGYGDGCIEIAPSDNEVTVLPENAEVKTGGFVYNLLSGRSGKNCSDAYLTQYAEVGDDYYLANPLGVEDSWIKGHIDREQGTVTFEKQYVGTYNGMHNWFVPANYTDVFDLWDEETGYGVWSREITLADAYVCKYENGSIISDEADQQTFVISRSADEVASVGSYSNIVVRPYEGKASRPVNPIIVELQEFNGLFANFAFSVPPIDNDKYYLDINKLYYTVYVNHEAEPFAFTTDEYWEIPEDMIDVPATYVDEMDFTVNNSFINTYFYYEFDVAGVQAVYKDGDQEYRSAIVWSDGTIDEPSFSAIETVNAPTNKGDGKFIENGTIVIVKNGKKYNLMGMPIK